VPFVFYGPTCDNLDKMKGPFLLPEDTQEGDWIEIGMLGAYGSTMATRFNGFHSSVAATVWPEAMPFAVDRPKRRPVLRDMSQSGAVQASLSLPMQGSSMDQTDSGEDLRELSADGNTEIQALELK